MDEKSYRRIYHYNLDVPTFASSILWASGYFESFAIPSIPNGFAFCSPGLLGSLRFSLDFLPKIYEYYSQSVLEGPLPYDSFKLVFLDSTPAIKIVGASVCLLR